VKTSTPLQTTGNKVVGGFSLARSVRLFSLPLVLALCVSCTSLPDYPQRVQTTKLEGSGSQLAALFHADIASHPGKSGVQPLGNGIDALAARVVLARSAEVSLDVQYYIWHADEAGRLLIKELLAAADRGVRVRLLLDDIGVGRKTDDAFMLLDAHPNVSVCLFNPISNRKRRTLGLVSDPVRLNHRMHNKSMTADSTLTILGGRNIGKEYFSLDELVNFADLDVLAVGEVASQVSDSFDQYWNSPSTYPVSVFHPQARDAQQLARGRAELEASLDQSSGRYYAAMRSSPFGDSLRNHDLTFYWGTVHLLYDSPEKAGKQTQDDVLLQQLKNMLGKVETDALIVSPYFVPGKKGTMALVDAAQRGVRVRVATNSLASTDVGAVHGGYKKSRISLLRGGVQLFELIPRPNPDDPSLGNYSLLGSSGASLHAKAFVFDHSKVFIGSMNLDPRSVNINTEIGLLIENPELADFLETRFDNSRKAAYYSVVLEAEQPGGREKLSWIEYRGSEELRYDHDPETGFWQRASVGFIGLFPIDSQL
jgi:putative cardiolipin synthase